VIVSAWPPVALIACVEVLAAMLRSRDPKHMFADHDDVEAEPVLDYPAETYPEPALEYAPTDVPDSDETVPTVVSVPEPVSDDELPGLNGDSADVHRVLAALGTDKPPSIREIKRVLTCGQPRAKEVQAKVQSFLSATTLVS
jgi:hypothetical protein